MSMPGVLTIERHWLTNTMVMMKLCGEMDASTTPDAKEAMLRLLESAPTRILVNLRHITFMDSTALGALIGVQRTASAQGCALHLVAPATHIRRLFDVTGLATAFIIYHTEEEAARTTYPGVRA